MASNAENALTVFHKNIGGEEGPTDWHEITQEQVNQFADATLDHQFIHVDPERARAETAYGGTIVHGFYLLSLLTAFTRSALPAAAPGAVEVNYGFDKVRLLAPVSVGARLRGHFTLAAETPKTSGLLRRYSVSVEIEGSDRPALAAEWLVLIVGG